MLMQITNAKYLPETPVFPSGMKMLEIRGIKKHYGAKQVLKGVDLDVARAEVLTILGPNGCGKSTFLRCLNLLENYQEGSVRLKGQIVSLGCPDEYVVTREEKDA